ncbi:SH3 domain-containing protein [Psychroserpens mesophilus]|uniref:SH3 domain-containing protein n=1 Tax=Psychroserpens mesophilus TaxID=325473 RepID=UPI00058C96F6|nr:SH3 domain-containing protein [Psychroserpens mesophilus]
MKTLKKTQVNKTSTINRIFQTLLIAAVLLIASDVFSQTKEVEFDVYTTSATKASKYLLADDVALRDCPSVQCEQLTTINIGTHVRLLAKSSTPHTINGIKSRWYKVKMGPQIGWIWGGMISQKTMISSTNPQVKFVFGEAGYDFKGNRLFQVRAIKNGAQIDKIVFQSKDLNEKNISLMSEKETNSNVDVIALGHVETNSSMETNTYIIFKSNKFQKTDTLAELANTKPIYTGLSYVSCEGE